MTDHARFQDDLKAYADGELTWPRRLAIRRHLTRCASCREELTQMTQIAEDLRASEPADALDPALRAKILGITEEEPTPVRSSPPLPEREGEEIKPTASPLRPPVSGGPLRSDLSRSKEVGSRKRLSPAWVLAGAALFAWFVFFPMFQHTQREMSPSASVPSAPGGQQANQLQSQVAKPSPPMHVPRTPPPTSAIRLSNREAGITRNGNADGFLQIKDPNSKYQNRSGLEFHVYKSDSAGSIEPFSPLAVSPAPQRQVHKEATIGVRVANPEATSDKVADMVKETGGFVAANNLSTGDDGLKSAELIVKVPVTQFETFLGQVAHLGSVQSKNVTGEDITEKKSDADQTENVLEGDVQNSEARLKALGSRAKWHDEQATRDLRTQLAEARARLILLKRMAALSTVTIDLSQTPKPPATVPVTGGFLNGLKASTHDALGSLVSSAGALIALVIWLLAYAPLWIPALIVGQYGLREYRKRSVGT